MSNLKDELKSIALRVNELLNEYIEIHNVVFDSPWWKSIPLPFIFKAIDFNNLNGGAKRILFELRTCDQQINGLVENAIQREKMFAQVLSKYCRELIETVSLLEGITHQLYLKSEGMGKYSFREYNKQCALYKNAVNNYISVGGQLNSLYSELYR